MTKAKDIFHKISYLQYPVLIVSLYYYMLFTMSLSKKVMEWSELNSALVFLGISLSLSTLQDTTKTQNKMSRKIWEHPTKGKIALILMSLMTVSFVVVGLFGYLDNTAGIQKELSFGLIVLGIGMLGLVKAAVEMFENHRKDKNFD